MATPTMIKISNICEAKFAAGHCSKRPDYINSDNPLRSPIRQVLQLVSLISQMRKLKHGWFK